MQIPDLLARWKNIGEGEEIVVDSDGLINTGTEEKHRHHDLMKEGTNAVMADGEMDELRRGEDMVTFDGEGWVRCATAPAVRSF